MNHWAECCLTRKPRDNKNKPHQRGRSKSRNEFRQGKHYHTNDTSVHQIRSNQQNTATLEQSFGALNVHEVKVSEMCLQQNNRDESYAQVQIKLNNLPGIHNLSAKIDTGAQGNTLPLRTFRRMYPDKVDADGFPVEHIVATARYARLMAYNGTSIPCHGIANIPCSYSNSAWNDTQFYIVDVTGPAVIGPQSCETLKLMTFHCTIKTHSSAEDAYVTCQPTIMSTSAINSVDDLTRIYPQQFDRNGCFPGEVKCGGSRSTPSRESFQKDTPCQILR